MLVTILKRWTIFVALAIGLIALLLSLKLVRFEHNDDPYMLMLASGAYTGTPDPHLIFIHQALGHVLCALYRQAPNLEWYTLGLLGLHALAFATTLTCLTAERPSRSLSWALITLILGVEMRCLSHLQFTTTAALLATSAVTLLTSGLLPRFPRLLGAAGAGMFLTASLLRFESAILVLLVSAPMLAWLIWREGRLALAILGLLLAGLGAVHLTYRDLSDPAWREYYAYNLARALVYDEPLAGQLQKLPASISESDYRLFLSAFPPLEKFDRATLQALRPQVQASSTSSRLAKLAGQMAPFQMEFLLLAVALALVLFAAERSHRLCLGLSLICFGGALAATAVTLVLKYRVFLAALSPLLVAAAWASIRSARRQPAAALGLALLGLYFGQQAVSLRLPLGENQRLFEQQISMLRAYLQTTERAVSPVQGSFHLDWGDPLRLSRDYPRGRIASLGWLTGVPLNRRFYRSFAELPERSALLLHKSNQALLGLLEQNLWENHQIAVYPVVMAEAGEFQIIELRRRDGSSQDSPDTKKENPYL